MNLEEYFEGSQIGPPMDDSDATVSDWMPFCTIPVLSGALWVGDPMYAWAEAQSGDGCVVDVPKGDYVIEAKGLESPQGKIVTRLRIFLQGSKSYSPGEVVGEAGTDSCQISVTDQKALREAFQLACGDDFDACMKLLEQQMTTPIGIVRPSNKSDGMLAYVCNGSDGGGPVLELRSGNQRVGIELEVFPVLIRMRCPIETCAGWVLGVEGSSWGCEECGYEWYSRDEINEAISEVIQKFEHRRKCYVKNGQNWDPVQPDHEPADYETQVEAELDDE
ncbi:MAG: hypothetical protein JW818_04255 [Pirellulales bacterium]|nr:hypothetical protein [Pirellulales bacterium]